MNDDVGILKGKHISLKSSNDGVSPVIGVILMVAITVVLAASVFIMLNNLGGDNADVPSITLQETDTDKYLITHASDGLMWSELSVVSCDIVPVGEVLAGQYLIDCDDNFIITYLPTNTVIYRRDS